MKALPLLQESRWEELAEYVSWRFSVDVRAKEMANVCRPMLRHIESRTVEGWSDESWDCWLKNRVSAMGKFSTGGAVGVSDIRFTVPLHVFFVSLEETLEMMARLPEGPPEKPKVARSKVFKTQRKPEPVDRVAMRVAPKPTE